MSVAGIASSFASLTSSFQSSFHNKIQTFRQDFEKLGQDLQSGNLAQAQTDFATLQKDAPPGLPGGPGSTQDKGPVGGALKQLSQDIQSGNLSAAQSDYHTLQQDLQKVSAHFHRHQPGGGGGVNQAGQLFAQLGQSLQNGNLSNAQQAYSKLLEELGGSSSNGSASQAAAASSGGSINTSA